MIIEPLFSDETGVRKNVTGRQKLHDRVASQIKAYILENGLRAGDHLPTEAQLASMFGASKTSVRAAIKSLELVGALEVQPGNGGTLRPFDLRALSEHVQFQYEADSLSIGDLVEARQVLEMAVLDLAVERGDEEGLRLMDESLSRVESLTIESPGWVQTEMMFHAAIVRSAGNQLFEAFTEVIREFFIYYQRSGAGFRPTGQSPEANSERVRTEHRKIRDAIASRDAVRARELLRDHLSRWDYLKHQERR